MNDDATEYWENEVDRAFIDAVDRYFKYRDTVRRKELEDKIGDDTLVDAIYM